MCLSEFRVFIGTAGGEVQTLGILYLQLETHVRTNAETHILQELLQKLDLIPVLNWNKTSIEAILMPVFQYLSNNFSCVSVHLKSLITIQTEGTLFLSFKILPLISRSHVKRNVSNNRLFTVMMEYVFHCGYIIHIIHLAITSQNNESNYLQF